MNKGIHRARGIEGIVDIGDVIGSVRDAGDRPFALEDAGGRLRKRNGVDYGWRARGMVHPGMQKFSHELRRQRAVLAPDRFDKIVALATFYAGSARDTAKMHTLSSGTCSQHPQ